MNQQAPDKKLLKTNYICLWKFLNLLIDLAQQNKTDYLSVANLTEEAKWRNRWLYPGTTPQQSLSRNRFNFWKRESLCLRTSFPTLLLSVYVDRQPTLHRRKAKDDYSKQSSSRKALTRFSSCTKKRTKNILCFSLYRISNPWQSKSG